MDMWADDEADAHAQVSLGVALAEALVEAVTRLGSIATALWHKFGSIANARAGILLPPCPPVLMPPRHLATSPPRHLATSPPRHPTTTRRVRHERPAAPRCPA